MHKLFGYYLKSILTFKPFVILGDLLEEDKRHEIDL